MSIFLRRAIVVAVASVSALATSASAAPAAADLHSFPPGPRPLPVTIGAYLIDFERIEESTGTCTLDGYLDLEWVDPRLRLDAVPAIDRGRLTIADIWWPNIEFYNQYDARDVANVQLAIKDDGTVVYEDRFRARLGCDLDFRRFPFDRQSLPLQIESFRYDASAMTLQIRPRAERMSARAFLPDWFISGVTERIVIDEGNPDRRPYSMYVFAIAVQRKSASYLWNIFLPLALITMLSWVVFWIGNKDFTNIAITTLVAAVAFAFVVAGGRPRQSYMTFMDAVVLNSYVIIFLANVTAVAVHYADWTGRTARSAALMRAARWSFPVLYGLALLLSVWAFFS